MIPTSIKNVNKSRALHCCCLWDVGDIELVPVKISIPQPDIVPSVTHLPHDENWGEENYSRHVAGQRLVLNKGLLQDRQQHSWWTSPSKVPTDFNGERQLCPSDDKEYWPPAQWALRHLKIPLQGPALRQALFWLHEPYQVQPSSYSSWRNFSLSFPHFLSIFSTGLGRDVLIPLVTHGKELLSLMIFPQGTQGF